LLTRVFFGSLPTNRWNYLVFIRWAKLTIGGDKVISKNEVTIMVKYFDVQQKGKNFALNK
jgi:hypothetical protein